MDLVVDASIAASWFLVDEKNTEAEAILAIVSSGEGHVPPIFWHELQNLLLKAERRGRCTVSEVDAAIRRARTLQISTSVNLSDHAVLQLARAHALWAYDAAYLDLAVSGPMPLATGDKRLAAAARACGVAILGPLAP